MTQKAISRIFWWVKLGWISGLTLLVNFFLTRGGAYDPSNPILANLVVSLGVLGMYAVLGLLTGLLVALSIEDSSVVPVWAIILGVIFGIPFYPWFAHSAVKELLADKKRKRELFLECAKKEVAEADEILRAAGIEPAEVDWSLLEGGHNA